MLVGAGWCLVDPHTWSIAVASADGLGGDRHPQLASRYVFLLASSRCAAWILVLMTHKEIQRNSFQHALGVLVLLLRSDFDALWAFPSQRVGACI